jgi:hypothetical protein
LKGGTSLSKGFGVIHRFSEDIDIRIEPPKELDVKSGKNHDKPAHVASRRAFYDWLGSEIKIDGIAEVTRDTDFDDDKMRSGGFVCPMFRAQRLLRASKTASCLSLVSTTLRLTAP